MFVESSSGQNGAFCRRVEFDHSDAVGFLVIDSLLGGGGTGGIRFGEGVTEQEVSELAHEMSLKFAWLNIPRGGAKAGICCGINTDEKTKGLILNEFGAALSDLLKSEKYIPGMDLGVGPVELAKLLEGAEIVRTESKGDSEIDSNFFTSLTVFVALETLLLQRGKRIENMTFLIEGIGKVGRCLIRLIDQAGGKIVGISTIKGAVVDQRGINVAEILELSERYGDDLLSHMHESTIISSAELYYQLADVLVPGARTFSIGENDVGRIQSEFVVPIANAAASRTVEILLHDRGICYLPGFVANSGGIFCWYLAPLSSKCRANMIRRGLSEKIRKLVAEAEVRNVAISTLAREQAEKNATIMAAETDGSARSRLVGFFRKISPRKLGYVVLRRLLGIEWARKDTFLCRWYFDEKFFS